MKVKDVSPRVEMGNPKYRRPLLEQAKLIDVYAQEWLHMNNREKAISRVIMQYLIEKGVFTHDNREGRPLRDVLRKLDEIHQLNLIRGLTVERKRKNRYWYFKRVALEKDCEVVIHS